MYGLNGYYARMYVMCVYDVWISVCYARALSLYALSVCSVVTYVRFVCMFSMYVCFVCV